jgi:hypothetical protein
MHLPMKHSYSVGGKEQTTGWQQILKERKSWAAESFELAKHSKAEADSRYWVLDIIANFHTNGSSDVPACDELRLLGITRITTGTQTVDRPDGQRQAHTPSTFHETWRVRACEHTYLWVTFDEGESIHAIFWGYAPADSQFVGPPAGPVSRQAGTRPRERSAHGWS